MAVSVRASCRPYRVAVYFLAGLAIVDILVARQSSLWEQYDPDDYMARVANCRRSPHDLLIIGGSPVSEGIDPAVLAGLHWQDRALVDAFNLGLPGGTTTEFWHAVRHGLAAPPRLIVYGITASDLNDGRQEPHGARVLIDPSDLFGWVRLKPSSAEWAVRHYANARLAGLWQLYRHRNAIRLWSAEQSEALWPGYCPDAAAEARANRTYAADLARGDGFAPNRSFLTRRLDLLKADGWRCDRFQFLEKYCVGEHLRYLHRLLDWADEHRVTVVLADMPVSADLETGPYAGAFTIYRRALSEMEAARRVRVVRGTRAAVGLGDEHFADLIHMNASGTARFSEWLREQLADARTSLPANH
jgi:hypothetical protein